MDDQPNHRQQRHRRRQRGKFTFIGETVAHQDEHPFTPEVLESEFRTDQVFPLSTTQVGDRVVIQKILTSQNIIHRLTNMGLTAGSEGEVISHRESGSVIIGIQDDAIGLNATIANQVMVTLVSEEASDPPGIDSDVNQLTEEEKTMDEGNRQGDAEHNRQKRSLMALANAHSGDQLWIAGYESKDGINRLVGMGLAPGMAIKVLQNLAGNVVVGVGDSRIGIDGAMAQRILVSDQPFDYLVEVEEVNDMETQKTTLKDLQVNQQGKVARFEATDNPTQKAYKKKLLAMGLTPGTEFTVTRVAPLGDPVEILVRGFKLSLRKDEAAALLVEALS